MAGVDDDTDEEDDPPWRVLHGLVGVVGLDDCAIVPILTQCLICRR